MAKKNNSAQGDKIDLGGKIPQFDTFAWLAYHELTQQNLDWIRIADPKALKLDDVQYATHQAIHAYQIKWSSQAPPVPFSYTDLLHLVKDLAEGWKALTVIHAGENKPVIPHLLSNRPRSSHDSIKEDSTGTKVGSFDDFYTQVWLKLKTNTPIASSWQSIADNFKKCTGLDETSFRDFVSKLELQFKYKRHVFGIGRVGEYQQNEDLKDFSRFLLEEIAYQNTTIQYSKEEIVIALDWTSRSKTTFNHELIIDKSRYQPISETVGKLNQKVGQYLSGYIFLVGGPGSGKSTLLTEWSRIRKERIIRYYAFDFTNPSSSLNYAERGAAVSLYFDLVFQLNAAGVNVTNTILQKTDLGTLRELFAQQLDKLGKEFQDTGRRTIIIIDGLDHVPREYKPIKSFLSELIQPKAIPNGVNLVLGSQTYDLEALQLDVELEWKSNSRTVKMDALNKKEAFAYIDASELELTLNEDDKEKVYEISQGHPLFLSYLISKLKTTKDLSSIKEFQGLDSDIGNYYSKIWKGVAKQSKLIDFFGLICRIKGKINPEFVLEWVTDENILLTFRQQAIHLFDVGDDGWVFFHNSFRQFLISETALNPLLNNWDKNKNLKYHQTLAHSYSVSIKEESWHALYHLFHSEDYLEFLKRATPESFIEQLQSYRPVAEIRDDIRLGLEVGKLQKDIYIVIQYLFASSELERRLYNLDPASFVKDFLLLSKNKVAKRYLRIVISYCVQKSMHTKLPDGFTN